MTPLAPLTPRNIYSRSTGNSSLAKVQLLLQFGSPHSSPTISLKQTPLHLASLNGSLEVVKILVDAGADKMAVNKDGRTPLQVAKNSDIAALLANVGT